LQASINIRESKEQITEKIKTMVDASPDQLSGSRVIDLTEREKTIVRLVSLGFTNKQIAGQLFLSAHTVITHRKNISSKLGIKSVSGLTVYAIVNNIITIEEVTSKPDQ
jgi:DNA-binding NarL/FixJ family response regulator